MPESYCQKAQESTILVAQAHRVGPIVGYGSLEPDGHIDHLYCHPDWTGQGIGTALCRHIEALARAAAIPALFVEASEGAQRLFLRHGFALVRRHDFSFNGTELHNYHLAKRLD